MHHLLITKLSVLNFATAIPEVDQTNLKNDLWVELTSICILSAQAQNPAIGDLIMMNKEFIRHVSGTPIMDKLRPINVGRMRSRKELTRSVEVEIWYARTDKIQRCDPINVL